MEILNSASFVKDFQACLGIVFSAITYLLDFSSNIATANEYHHMVEVRPSWIGIFIGMVTVMVLAHITNALVFKLELKKEDQPLKAAYLFPLIQLSRLVQVLWRTGSWKGLGDLKADDKNTLYNILSVSLETGPQLTLQFVVFLLYYKKTGGQPPKTLMVSILASFLSGTVNGGLAILGVSHIKTQEISWRQKMVGFIISGLFTSSALLLQCITYTVLMLWGWENGYPIAGYVTMELSFYFILFIILLRRRSSAYSNQLRAYCNGKRFFHCVALSYLSAKIGALQPLTSDARVKDELGKAVYWYRLLLVSAVHLCLYAGVFLLCSVGPLHSRWSSLCPKHLSIMSPDRILKGFPCSWYTPATIIGMLIYSATISSHIIMDKYVNRKEEDRCIQIHPVLSTIPCSELDEFRFESSIPNNIDDISISMHIELQEKDNAHQGNGDEEEGGFDVAGKLGRHDDVQIECEGPSSTGTTKKQSSSHSQGDSETTARELEGSNEQVEISYDQATKEIKIAPCEGPESETTEKQTSSQHLQGEISYVHERATELAMNNEASRRSVTNMNDALDMTRPVAQSNIIFVPLTDNNMDFQEDEQNIGEPTCG